MSACLWKGWRFRLEKGTQRQTMQLVCKGGNHDTTYPLVLLNPFQFFQNGWMPNPAFCHSTWELSLKNESYLIAFIFACFMKNIDLNSEEKISQFLNCTHVIDRLYSGSSFYMFHFSFLSLQRHLSSWHGDFRRPKPESLTPSPRACVYVEILQSDEQPAASHRITAASRHPPAKPPL